MVRNLIQVQDSYINTYHPDFMGGANSIVNVFDVNSYNKIAEARKKTEQSFDGQNDGIQKGQAQTR